MEEFQNCLFTGLALEHQGSQVVFQAVDLDLTLLWPSVESRLKMQQFITVRVIMKSTVSMCSHSEKAWYKNLPQSDWTETELTAAAGSFCRDWHTSLKQLTHFFFRPAFSPLNVFNKLTQSQTLSRKRFEIIIKHEIFWLFISVSSNT